MHDARPPVGPSAGPSVLDLVCVAALTALLFWGAYAVAGFAHAPLPAPAATSAH